jgi:hypothetical protein
MNGLDAEAGRKTVLGPETQKGHLSAALHTQLYNVPETIPLTANRVKFLDAAARNAFLCRRSG